MKFSKYKQENRSNFDLFTMDELNYKGFVKLSFDEFLKNNPSSPWYIDIDNKAFNSYPNFTQKHKICLSHSDFNNSVFQFRISSENSVDGLGYRLFINLDGIHKDFVATEIAQTDDIVMKLKEGILKEFNTISRCGWWITDIWRDLHSITDDSDSDNFIQTVINHSYTKEMIKINNKLLKAQNNGQLNSLIIELKKQD